MPVFNGEDFIEKAIESILTQKFIDFKLIIADNCSTDQTPLICTRLSSQDSRIEYYQHDKNEGPFYNFQFVLNKADSPYFMWASHDDYWYPDFILELVNILNMNDDCIIAFPVARYVDERGALFKQNPCLGKSLQPDDREESKKNTLKNSSLYKFLYADFSIGKLDLFYGLFKKNDVDPSRLIEKWKDVLWGSDSLTIAEILMHGNAYFFDKVLMDVTIRRNSLGGVSIDKTKSLLGVIIDLMRTLYIVNVWAIKGHNRLFKVKSRYKMPFIKGYSFIAFEVIRANLQILNLVFKGVLDLIKNIGTKFYSSKE